MPERRYMWPRLLKTSFVVSIFLLSILSAIPSYSLTPVYVDPGLAGSDANPGTIGSPKKTINGGLGVVSAGGIIYLVNGIYSGAGNNDINWPSAATNITMIAQNTGLATIDGSGAVKRLFNIGDPLRITFEGMTIQNFKPPTTASNSGGVIRISPANSEIFTFRNILVRNCTAELNSNGGGFLYSAGTASKYLTMEVIGSTFIGNRGVWGGVIFGDYARITMTDCLIKWNKTTGTANGGGAVTVTNGGRITLDNCTFEGNSTPYAGGALSGMNASGYRAIIKATDCTFNNNSAQYAGAIYFATAEVDNCLFTKNTASDSNGVMRDGAMYAKNCVFAYNSAPTTAIMYYYTFTATNCVIAKNTNTAGLIIDTATKLLRYCVIQPDGYVAGIGNVAGEASFVSTWETSTYFMWPAAGSLAIDAGTKESAISTLDASGAGRPLGLAVDAGPFEFKGPSIRLTFPNSGEVLQAGQSYNITWKSSCESGFPSIPIILRFSSDKGLTWTQIDIGALVNSGTYSWTVPDLASRNCLISIEVQSNTPFPNNWNCDTSDATFEIQSRNIYVSPNGSDEGNGTIGNPLRTIAKAMMLTPGTSEIRLMAGMYTQESYPIIWPNKQNITLIASPGATGLATLDARVLAKGISIGNALNITIEGITIQRCKTTNNGAAISGVGATAIPANTRIWLNNMSIRYCTADAAVAGGLWCTDDTVRVYANNSQFIGNDAYWSGFYHRGTWIVNNCTFRGNRAIYGYSDTVDVGGGVGAFGVWYVQNSTFDANSAYYVGGAFDSVTTMVATGCVFSSNFAQEGGVFYRSYKDTRNWPMTWTTYNCTFINNRATGQGGAGRMNGAASAAESVTSYNTSFISNEANVSGGVAYGGYFNMVNSVFSNNKSKSTAAENGGGVAYSITWRTMGCTYEYNSAQYRGGVFEQCPVVATNCAFSYNTAPNTTTGVGYGGVIMNYNGTSTNYYDFTANNCVFIGNTSPRGGALSHTDLYLNNCIFFGNIGSIEGGAIQQGGDAITNAYNCAFYGNRSPLPGNSVHYNGSTQPFNAINCVYWDNTYPVFSTTPECRYSDIQPNAYFLKTGSISSEPKFMSTNEANLNTTFFRPSYGSRLIDAGIKEAIIPTADASGWRRPYGTMADIGPYEFHGPSIRVLTPNGGETLSPGVPYNITWRTSTEASKYASNPINLYYSSDNGGSWTLIQDNLPNTSSYPWTPPEIGTAWYLISIEAKGGPSGAPAPYDWNYDISDNPFTVRPGVVYVSPSGNDVTGTGTIDAPLRTITSALSVISPTGEVRLMAGMYTQEAFPLYWPNKQNIRLVASPDAGGLATIDARSTNKIIFGPVGTINLTIEGITLQNGKTSTSNGGGISLEAGNRLWLKNVIIQNCTVEGAGTNNGGAIFADNAFVYANNSRFLNNRVYGTTTTPYYGSGGAGYMGTWEVNNCIFTGNYCDYNGGALITGNHITARNCIFSNNTAAYGGAVCGSFLLTMYNCSLSNNKAIGPRQTSTVKTQGGALFLVPSMILVNCSVVNNSAVGADAHGGAIGTGPFNVSGNIKNTIFWGNTSSNGGDYVLYKDPGGTGPSSTYSFTYCDMQPIGGLAGTGNIQLDPLLVSTFETDSNYMRLSAFSPCIDLGINTTGVPTYDGVWNNRSHGFNVDIGPYEFQGPSITTITPASGESYVLGTIPIKYLITDEYGVACATLEFSTDSGATWNYITTEVSLPNNSLRTYNWVTFETVSNHMRIRASCSNVLTGETYNYTITKGDFSVASLLVYVSNSSGSDDAGNGSYSKPFKTIQKGLDNVSPGGIVSFEAGAYSGTGNTNVVWPNKNNITLHGSGHPFIFGNSTNLGFQIAVSGINLTLESFSMLHCTNSTGYGGAIHIESVSPHIWLKDMLFDSCHSGSNGGVIGSSSINVNTIEADNCTFQNNSATTWAGAIYAPSSEVYLRNCLFQQNTAGQYGGVGYGGKWDISYCTFEGNTCPLTLGKAGGVICFTSNHGKLKVNHCLFKYNQAYTGSVFYIYQSNPTTTIESSIFYFNTAGAESGTILTWSPVILNNCVFYKNIAGPGAVGQDILASSTNVYFKNSVCYGPGNADRLYLSNTGFYAANAIFWGDNTSRVVNTIALFEAKNCDLSTYETMQTTCVSFEPVFVSPEALNFRLIPGSPLIDIGTMSYSVTSTDAAGNVRPYPPNAGGLYADIGAYEFQRSNTDLYVDPLSGDDNNDGTSEATALKTIRNALYRIGIGKKIILESGVYNEGELNNWPANPLIQDVSMVSFNGTWETVIVTGNNNNRVFNFSKAPTGLRGTLEGFAITGGSTLDFGAGVLLPTVTGIVVRKCLIQDNSATGGGAGMMNGKAIQCTFTGNSGGMNSYGGAANNSLLERCIVDSNTANRGGGMYTGKATNCTFTNNHGNEGGALNQSSAESCVLSDNSAGMGAGIYLGTASNSTFSHNVAGDKGGGAYNSNLTNCIFVNNAALTGGGFYSNQAGSYINCLLYNNTGDGAYLDNSSALFNVTNCTFNNNAAYNININAGSGKLKNCIVWDGVVNKGTSAVFLPEYSDIQDYVTMPGDHNITVEPLFKDAPAGNFRLQPTSPCIDSGTGVGAPSFDLDNNPRPAGTAWDMGAYEYSESVVHLLKPTGADLTLEAGMPYMISWEVRDQLGDLIDTNYASLYFTQDNGTTWTPIEVDFVPTPDKKPYPWTIPGILSTQCLISVEVSKNPGQPDSKDMSSSSFTIWDTILPEVIFNNPTFNLIGAIYPITWEVRDHVQAVNPVKLEFTTNEGLSIATLADNRPTMDSYTLSFPSGTNLNYPECWFRITAHDLAGNFTTVESNPFGVDTKPPTFEVSINYGSTEAFNKTIGCTVDAWDENGIKEIDFMAGEGDILHHYTSLPWPTSMTLVPPTIGLHYVTFEFVDNPGNITSETLYVTLHLQATAECTSLSVNDKPAYDVHYLPRKSKVKASIVDYHGAGLSIVNFLVKEGKSIYTFPGYSVISPTDVTLNSATGEINLPFSNGNFVILVEMVGPMGDISTYESTVFSITNAAQIVGAVHTIPNPFRPRHGEGTTFKYQLASDASITIMIYDITGRLLWQRVYSAGSQGGRINDNNVLWNGINDFGDYVPNGAYIFLITSGDKILVKGQLAVAD